MNGISFHSSFHSRINPRFTRAVGSNLKIRKPGLFSSFVPNLNRLRAVSLTLTLCSAALAQRPDLGDSKAVIKQTLLNVSIKNAAYLNNYGVYRSAPLVTEKGDTLVYRASGADETQLEYVFSNGICVGIHLKFACLTCLVRSYRKDLFKGTWRVDESGYLYRSKNPARASIRRAVDCPFLYEVNVTRMDAPPLKDSLRKMRRVKKKWLGTFGSLLTEQKTSPADQ